MKGTNGTMAAITHVSFAAMSRRSTRLIHISTTAIGCRMQRGSSRAFLTASPSLSRRTAAYLRRDLRPAGTGACDGVVVLVGCWLLRSARSAAGWCRGVRCQVVRRVDRHLFVGVDAVRERHTVVSVGDVRTGLAADDKDRAEMCALDYLDQILHYARIVKRRRDQASGTQDVVCASSRRARLFVGASPPCRQLRCRA